MSIDRTPSSSPIHSLNALSDLRTASQSRERQAASTVRSDDDHVSLSSHAQQATADSSRDINTARLAELRSALDAGTYSIDADRIAAVLVDEMFHG